MYCNRILVLHFNDVRHVDLKEEDRQLGGGRLVQDSEGGGGGVVHGRLDICCLTA